MKIRHVSLLKLLFLLCFISGPSVNAEVFNHPEEAPEKMSGHYVGNDPQFTFPMVAPSNLEVLLSGQEVSGVKMEMARLFIRPRTKESCLKWDCATHVHKGTEIFHVIEGALVITTPESKDIILKGGTAIIPAGMPVGHSNLHLDQITSTLVIWPDGGEIEHLEKEYGFKRVYSEDKK